MRPASPALVIFAAALGGCATPKPLPPTFTVEAGGYDAAFDAVRATLRASRFEIERVDAGAGVISTSPKQSAGLATPWDGEQSTMHDEFEDLGNHQQRTVRVTFEPAGTVTPPAPGSPGPSAPESPLGETTGLVDLRTYPGPLVGRVLVVIEREHRPGRRVSSVAIASSTFTQDPALGPRGMAGAYWTPVAQDPLLAGRLAAKIRKSLAPPAGEPAPPGTG
jgi:hypothetical protein